MRSAISISPSRVSSGTVPISRRYMRTGSLIFSLKSCGQLQIEQLFAFFELLVELLGFFEDLDAGGVEIGEQIVEIARRRSDRRAAVR